MDEPEAISFKFSCEKCSYHTNTKQHYDNHLVSNRHINDDIKPNTDITFECKLCNKKYFSANGLQKHFKKCKVKQSDNQIETNDNGQPNWEKIMQRLEEQDKKLENQAQTIQDLTNIIMQLSTPVTEQNKVLQYIYLLQEYDYIITNAIREGNP